MNKKIVVLLSFLFILFFIPLVFSQEIPTLTPFVNDFANVIPQTYRSLIQSLSEGIESSTGAQIAVLTVNSTQPMSIEEYAVNTFEKNGIGQKGVDNGVLIVAAIQDRKWRIEVGYGLEGVINDAKAGNIGRTYMTTSFKEGKYGEGLYNTVKTIGDLIISSNETSVNQNQTQPFSLNEFIIPFVFISVVPFIIIIVIIIIFLRTVFIKKCPECGSKMHTHIHYDSIEYHCPKCGYKTVKKKKRVHWMFVGGGSGGGWGGGGGGGFGGGGSGGGGASDGW
jgi:uncharacterized protein